MIVPMCADRGGRWRTRVGHITGLFKLTGGHIVIAGWGGQFYKVQWRSPEQGSVSLNNINIVKCPGPGIRPELQRTGREWKEPA